MFFHGPYVTIVTLVMLDYHYIMNQGSEVSGAKSGLNCLKSGLDYIERCHFIAARNI